MGGPSRWRQELYVEREGEEQEERGQSCRQLREESKEGSKLDYLSVFSNDSTRVRPGNYRGLPRNKRLEPHRVRGTAASLFDTVSSNIGSRR